MSVGHRASGYVRLADMIVAGLSAAPRGMRESSLALVASTRTASVGSGWETWNDRQLIKALMRLVDSGLIDMTQDGDGRRWHLRPPSDETLAWARAERRVARHTERIVRRKAKEAAV